MLACVSFFALVSGGCAKRATQPEVAAAAYEAPQVSAPETGRGRGASKSTRGANQNGARTLSLLDLGRTTGPDTPMDQLLGEGDRPLPTNGLCPPDMASVDDLYCVDRYEASLIEILPNGDERPWSAFLPVDDGKEGNGAHSKVAVRAVSEPGTHPQAYISEMQAKDACARSGKRLCKAPEWRKACMGPEKSTYGYGNTEEPKRCNTQGKSPISMVFGGQNLGDEGLFTWNKMNNELLNQLQGTLAKTGQFEDCANGYGVHDMVGNLHEWVDDPEGTFLGGYYQDTHLNGDGCQYRTMAHAAWYHDYSTGFRCCADVGQ
jgi:formylglycine-generating enzyme